MEELMQYVWHHRLWWDERITTVDGVSVRVIDPGQLNRDAGPDFFNAKVKIGDRMWCGNVEIHVRASDWMRHGHHTNPAYDSVILHVVEFDDAPIYRTNGELIPQIKMPCARDFSARYGAFINNTANAIACSAELGSLPELMVRDWLDSMAFERLHAKADAVAARLEQCVGDWETAAYVTLARALGAGINGDAFERVAKSMPLRFLRKHSDSLTSIEALLFGQSGLLDYAPADDRYVESLRREYEFLANKFSLHRPSDMGWRMSRMRPASFPHRRLAMLARMVEGGFQLMQRLLEVKTEDDARALFRVELSGYWVNHFNFGPPSPVNRPSAMGHSTVDMLVINVVVPLLTAYGEATDDAGLSDRAVDILEHLPGEKNRLTEDFTRAGIRCRNAFDSQAMVELHRVYCDARKCLHCRLGHKLLAKKIKP
jgi:hypothetical protein